FQLCTVEIDERELTGDEQARPHDEKKPHAQQHEFHQLTSSRSAREGRWGDVLQEGGSSMVPTILPNRTMRRRSRPRTANTRSPPVALSNSARAARICGAPAESSSANDRRCREQQRVRRTAARGTARRNRERRDSPPQPAA